MPAEVDVAHIWELVEDVTELIHSSGPDGSLLYANRAWRETLGYGREELAGLTVGDVIQSAHLQNGRGLQTRPVDGETVQWAEIVLVAKDGRSIAVEGRMTCRFEQGQPAVTHWVCRAPGGHWHAEELLRESEERYRLFVERARDIIYRTDAQGRFTFCNPSVGDILGYTEAELVGRLYMDLIRPDLREAAEDFYRRQFRERTPATYYEFAALAKDGSEVWLGQEVQILLAEDQIVGFQAICRDISARVRAEDERRRLETKLRHTQKLEGLGVMAGGIAHDFNNLLTVMVGNATLASRYLPAESDARPLMVEIEKAGRRAAELAQQMLAYSGKGRSVLKVLRLDAVVQEMAKLLESVVSKKAFLRLDLRPSTVKGDDTQIRQVVMNLITNASDALGDEPGIISIRTGVQHMDATALTSPFLPTEPEAGEYAYIEVGDNGCGMSEDTLPKIFDPFFTTKFTGRGLGLAAVLGIVRGHRGAIQVSSTPSHGTTFTVLFPSVEPMTIEAPAAALDWEQWKGSGVLLVVEDDETVRALARRVLEGAGFEVRVAGNGQSGLEVLEQHGPEIRGMLVDLTMPHLDGFQVLRRLRDASSTVPVLLMSGYAEHEAAGRAVGLGASGFLQKPFRPADLLAKVSQMLGPEPAAVISIEP